MLIRRNSFGVNHAAGKRTAEARRCPKCGRAGALTNRLDERGDRVCRWADSGRCAVAAANGQPAGPA